MKKDSKLKSYYYLAKPGIVYGNSFVAIGGFIFGSSGKIDLSNMFNAIIGLALIMASACVLNNYIDRFIDSKMKRTQKRALVTGAISSKASFIYAAILGLVGLVLISRTTFTASLVAVVGVFFYVIVYGIAKRKTYHGTAVGSIAGAVPPLVGYSAATNKLDVVAINLFIIMVFWQMAHFYAITIFRLKEYSAAKIPVVSIVKGIKPTKQLIFINILLFAISTFGLYISGKTTILVPICMSFLSALWAYIGYVRNKKLDDYAWSRKMFKYSLRVLMAFSLVIAISTI